MTARTKSRQELLAQIEELRLQLEEAQETLQAIRSGEVDALVVAGPHGDSIFTLSGADRPYRVLIEAMNEGALTLSTDGVILYCNTRFADLVCTPMEHVIGTPLHQFATASDRPTIEALFASGPAASWRSKVNLMQADSVPVPVQLSAQPVTWGELQAMSVVVTDLTSVVAAEAALRRAHDDLERRVEERTAELRHANELRLRFLAMISHELRTPLASIKGFASTLLAQDVDWKPEEQQEFIRTIDQESDKLTDMIDQILDLSSIEIGTLRINPKVATLNEIMTNVLPELQRIVGNHELRVDIPDRSPALKVDQRRIDQVLANLVENAAKYSPDHSLIEIAAHETDIGVQVSIVDQGTGISAQERPYVFEAFRRGNSDQAKQTKGAGLGLAICKGLIEAHGGRIWIQDHEGPGTTICFTLPRAT